MPRRAASAASLERPATQIRVAQKAEPQGPIGAVVGLGPDHGVFEQGDGIRRAPHQRVCPAQRGRDTELPYSARFIALHRANRLFQLRDDAPPLPTPEVHPGNSEPGEWVRMLGGSVSSDRFFGDADSLRRTLPARPDSSPATHARSRRSTMSENGKAASTSNVALRQLAILLEMIRSLDDTVRAANAWHQVSCARR